MHDDMTEAAMFAAEIAGRGKSEMTTPTRVQKTCKLYPHVAFHVAALAHSSGLSQNEIINRLIQVGVEGIKSEMTDEERQKAFTLEKAKWEAEIRGAA